MSVHGGDYRRRLHASEMYSIGMVSAASFRGAENILSAALANDVEQVVALSRDKAANPDPPVGRYQVLHRINCSLLRSIWQANDVLPFRLWRYGNVSRLARIGRPIFRKTDSARRDVIVDYRRRHDSFLDLVAGKRRLRSEVLPTYAWRRDLCTEVAVDPDSRPCNGDCAAPVHRT